MRGDFKLSIRSCILKMIENPSHRLYILRLIQYSKVFIRRINWCLLRKLLRERLLIIKQNSSLYKIYRCYHDFIMACLSFLCFINHLIMDYTTSVTLQTCLSLCRYCSIIIFFKLSVLSLFVIFFLRKMLFYVLLLIHPSWTGHKI